MTTFEIKDDDLPYAGRALCRDAIAEANKLVDGVDPARVENVGKSFMQLFVSHLLKLGGGDGAIPDFSSLNFTSIFDAPDDMEGIEGLLQTLSIDIEKSEIATFMLSDDLEPLIISFMLMYFVQSLKKAESTLLDTSACPDYKEAMKYIDSHILIISRYCNFARTLKPGTELLKTKIERKAGAKKGAAVKNARLNELKAMILEEAAANHADKSAAQAARDIIKFVGLESHWFHDDKGRALLKDPEHRLTLWIRKGRAHRKKSAYSA